MRCDVDRGWKRVSEPRQQSPRSSRPDGASPNQSEDEATPARTPLDRVKPPREWRSKPGRPRPPRRTSRSRPTAKRRASRREAAHLEGATPGAPVIKPAPASDVAPPAAPERMRPNAPDAAHPTAPDVAQLVAPDVTRPVTADARAVKPDVARPASESRPAQPRSPAASLAPMPPFAVPLPRAKSAAAAPRAPAELPGRYDEDRVVLLIRDPNWCYVCWEVAPISRARLGAAGLGPPVVRFYEVTGVDWDGTNHLGSFDVSVHDDLGSWYVETQKPGASFVADLGLRRSDGSFASIARSNRVDMPRSGPSPRIDPAWPTIEGAPGWFEMSARDLYAPSSIERSERRSHADRMREGAS